jgi:hypothetical protein
MKSQILIKKQSIPRKQLGAHAVTHSVPTLRSHWKCELNYLCCDQIAHNSLMHRAMTSSWLALASHIAIYCSRKWHSVRRTNNANYLYVPEWEPTTQIGKNNRGEKCVEVYLHWPTYLLCVVLKQTYLPCKAEYKATWCFPNKKIIKKVFDKTERVSIKSKN